MFYSLAGLLVERLPPSESSDMVEVTFYPVTGRDEGGLAMVGRVD
ncbi:hypothetical protein AAGW18_22135 [Vreelandella titanicae]|jgi:hypothetical protein|nr:MULTISPECIES: hypothetical protein [Halomonas]|tara:strand:- start:1160 stop:1294 length:135 start_codon:yes stop_codon:yes gene_type:complete